MEYFIHICPRCKKQVSEDQMGLICSCGEWLYHYTSKKIVVIQDNQENKWEA